MFSRLHMPLDPETRLGPYKIVRAIGAGGLGEGRARDPQLGRDVAVKASGKEQLVFEDGLGKFAPNWSADGGSPPLSAESSPAALSGFCHFRARR